MFKSRWVRRRSSIKDSDFFALSLRIAAIKKSRPPDDFINGDAPIVWERMSNGYRIVDLQLNKFMQALHFVLAYYSNSEPLFKCIKLCDDATSMKTFMNMVFKQMEGMIGFCAIREGSNELVGVLIASLFKKFNWIIKKGQGETLCHVMSLKNYAFAKSRFIESIYINKSVHIDIICVKPDHQRRGVGTALLRSCITRVSNFTSIIFGQFTSSAAQTIAKRLNFDIIDEIPYKNLSLQNIRFEIFESCHPENYSIAHMMLKIIPILKISAHVLEARMISEEKIKLDLKQKIDSPKKKKKRIHVVY